MGGLDDGLPRVSHVGDDAVCQDQQDEVFLGVEGETVGGGRGEGRKDVR